MDMELNDTPVPGKSASGGRPAMTARAGCGAALLAASLLLAAPTGAGAQTFAIPDGDVSLVTFVPGTGRQVITRHNRQLPEGGFLQPIRVNLPGGSPTVITCDTEPLSTGPGIPDYRLADRAEFSGAARFFPSERSMDQFTVGGENFLQFSVRVNDDDIVEANEVFRVTCLDGTTSMSVQADITILDDDTAEMAIEQGSGARTSVAEDAGNVEFRVTLTGPVPTEVTARWTVAGDPDHDPRFSATTADDFDQTTGMVTFAAGQTTQTISVPITDDNMGESPEDFVVRLSDLSGSPRDGAVSLSATGATARGRIQASDTTLSIADASASEGETMEFTVTRAGPGNVEIMVDWAVSRGTGDTADAADFGGTFPSDTLTVPMRAAGATTTISFPIPDDMQELDAAETFTITLSNPRPASVLLRNADPSGMPGITATATGRIRDADAVTVSIADAGGDEGGAVAFAVTLSGPPGGAVTVDYATAPGTGPNAAVQADFTATMGTLTFAADATGDDLTQTIEVPTVDDADVEDDETFTVTLSGLSGPAHVDLDTATATGTIRDDDVLRISIADASGTEEDGSIDFEVTLSASPAEAVTVDWVASAGTAMSADFVDLMAARGTLNFFAGATGDDLKQTISIPIIDDGVEEGDETFTVTLSEPPGGLPDGVSLDPAATTATGTIRGTSSPSGARAARVSEAILPHVAGAMAESAVSALAGRIASAASGAPPSRLSGLAGKPDFLDALRSGGRTGGDGSFDLERALRGSSFVLSANAAGGDRRAGDFAVWGSGDWRNLSGPDDSAVDWDGDLSGFHLGADVRLRSDLLAGVAVSRHSGSFDYTDRTDPEPVQGSYDTSMTGVHPYAAWSPSRGPALWAMAGWSEGEIEIAERGGDRHRSDTAMWTAAVGASQELASDDRLIAGGTAKLRLKGEGSATRVEIEGGGDVQPAEYDVQRLRVALEGAYECLAGTRVGCLAPSLEAGLRHDGGDATTGLGVEVGGGLRWTDRASGLTVEGRGRVLVADADDREDWGVGGLIRLDPGADGRGLSFSVTPGFGDAARGIARLYDGSLPGSADGAAAPSGRVETEIGYGFGDGPLVVVTPYSGAALGEAGSRSWRAGVRLEAGPSLGFSVEGMRRERGGAAPDHGVTARGRLRW